MPARNIERELVDLAALRNSESADERICLLRKALNNKTNVIVAKAAALAADMHLRELIPDLCASFERLLKDPLKTDPQCWGKDAIAKALKNLEHNECAVFLKGAQHVQLEPVWGGQEDTATNLRSTCALALLQCSDLTRDEKLWSIMRLLTERSASLRKDAALALESLEGREAALMLRIKARMGDSDPTVTGQAFESLLRVEGDSAIPFVVEFLGLPNSDVREEAALALGASRLSTAVAALKTIFVQKRRLIDSEVLCRALSISRNVDAVQFLVDTIQTNGAQEALAALDALRLYQDSSEICQRITEAVANRTEPEIQRAFKHLFNG
jgi:HEAT repeat protein